MTIGMPTIDFQALHFSLTAMPGVNPRLRRYIIPPDRDINPGPIDGYRLYDRRLSLIPEFLRKHSDLHREKSVSLEECSHA